MPEPSGLTWSTGPFEACYNAIRFEKTVPMALISPIKPDLLAGLAAPARNDDSRAKLAKTSQPVTLPSGEEVSVNSAFAEEAVLLAAELDLDELCVAELLYNASLLRHSQGLGFSDSGRLAYFSRLEYILNILGYLVSTHRLDTITSDANALLTIVLQSFTRIYRILDVSNGLVDKQKASSDINSLQFANTVSFVKNKLLVIHELLGELLFSLVDTYAADLVTSQNYIRIVAHVAKELADDDVLTLHYLPALLRMLTSDFSDSEANSFHHHIVKVLETDYKKISTESDMVDLSKSSIKGFEVVLHLVFLTTFTSWCKKHDLRTAKYDFKHDILKYIDWLIDYGAMEKLLCLTADSSTTKTQETLDWSNLYDFRSLLQRTFPRLSPVKFTFPGSQELIHMAKSRPGLENVFKLLNTSHIRVSEAFCHALVAPFFHKFFSDFINNAAIILTLLRDSEEDFLLSSMNKKQLEVSGISHDDKKKSLEDAFDIGNKNKSSEKYALNDPSASQNLNLDEISARSDLERFYLAFVYTYSNRPGLSSLFWEADDDNDIIGFFAWGLSNNTSPLITATFCLLLASLTSGGDEISCKIWEILVRNNNSSLKKNDYSKISIDSIVDSLNYYIESLTENFEQDLSIQLKQQQKRKDYLFSSSFQRSADSDNVVNEKIVIELAEDSLIFIAGFFQLISSIVKNLSSKNIRSAEIKNIAFIRFSPIIRGFLRFDNLVTGSADLTINSGTNDRSNGNTLASSTIQIDAENRTNLVNLLLNFLSDFVANEEGLDLRFKVWDILDRWIYQGLNEPEIIGNTTNQTSLLGGYNIANENNTSSKFQGRRLKAKQGFQVNLTLLSEVTNFANLLRNLLRPLKNDNEAFDQYGLLYPADLGFTYRLNNQVGVWPYIEYLLLEVFSKSNDLKDEDVKHNLKSTILEIISSALNEIDWVFLNDVAPNVINGLSNLNSVVDTTKAPLTYQLFVKLHHSLAVMNYLFDEKANMTIFGIINLGMELVNESEKVSSLVQSSLSVLEQLLHLQDTYLQRLLPMLRNNEIANNTTNKPMGFGTSLSVVLSTPTTVFDQIYYPSNIGTNGIANFYEIILFNLSSVAHIALYAGSSNPQIANLAIKILRKVSTSSFFVAKANYNSSDLLLNKNRLLTVFESIDESVKIQYAFIRQLEAFTEDLSVKYNILNLLIENLLSIQEPSISHFLLGYEIRGGNLVLADEELNSLLKCLMALLNSSLEYISDVDFSNNSYNHVIGTGPAKLSSMILKVLVTLCRNPISSKVTLNHLRQYDDLFTKLVQSQPKVDAVTVWHESMFNGELQDEKDNHFIIDEMNTQSFFAFINHRNLMLQYLSLEFHDIKTQSKKEYYIDLLLNGNDFLSGSPKILNFLDILNFSFANFEGYKYEKFVAKYNLPLLLQHLKEQKDGKNVNFAHGPEFLSKVIKLVCQNAARDLHTREAKISFSQEIMDEANKMEEFLTKYLLFHELKASQHSCLHSWVQVIQVLLTDGGITKSDFILEVLQVVLPKINDYFESDISFSEELISLCVLLFDLYEQENLLESVLKEKKTLYIQRLIPLFKTCVSGVLSSNSTPSLRSDLYILLNKFLQKVFHNEELLAQVVNIFRSFDAKFIDIICNDSIYSEGSSRVTSILFLESLVHLSSASKSSFILDAIIKNNSLLLLVRSIKRTDEMISYGESAGETESGVRLETLLYELTAFKASLYLLIRVAQSRVGASQLIQNEIFPIIKQLNFLAIDPDIGLNLRIDSNGAGTDNKEAPNVTVNLSLDIPLSLTGPVGGDSGNTISYFEFFVPIFQLVSAVLLSMGPSYKPSILQIKDLLKHFHKLIVGVVKRDMLVENKQLTSGIYKDEHSISVVGLKELVKLFTLLDSLVNHGPDEASSR